MITSKSKPLRFALAQALCRRLPPVLSQRVRAWAYPRALGIRDDYEFVASSLTGGMLRGTTSDLFSWAFGVNGYHEWRLLAVATALCGPGDTIIEVGANVGTETVGFADLVGAHGRLVAFEPVPALRERLRDLVERNGYRNVTLFPYALSNESGAAEFVVPSSENSGLGHIAIEGAAGERIPVEVRTLDGLGDELGPARIIYADIEGSEYRMLCGGRAYIAQYRPALVLEAHAKNARQLGVTLEHVNEELCRQEYVVRTIERLGLGTADVGSEELMTWLCLHSSQTAKFADVGAAILRCGVMPPVRRWNPLVGN